MCCSGILPQFITLIIKANLLLDCYSTVQDLICQENNQGNAMDQIFYRGGCKTIEEICNKFDLSGLNINFCYNESLSVEVPLNEVIKRTLSAEEFF